MELVAAKVNQDGHGIAFINRTAHRVTFWVQGAVPEVGITLDGNMRWSTNITPNPKCDTISVRLDGPEGPVLDSISK